MEEYLSAWENWGDLGRVEKCLGGFRRVLKCSGHFGSVKDSLWTIRERDFGRIQVRLRKFGSVKGPSTKYDHFMRVCTDKNEENEKLFT